MGGCSAINCSNHSRGGFQMFRFPRDQVRRKIWTIKCRRENWVPGLQAQICSVHFEENQFELHRQDGKKKLKSSAVPTLFSDLPKKAEKQKSKSATHRKCSANADTTSLKNSRATRKKGLLCLSVQKKKHSSDTSPSQHKENVSPRQKFLLKVEQGSSSEEELVSGDDEGAQQIALLKQDMEFLKQENKQFEKYNKTMSCVILELEMANKDMSMKLQELYKDNKMLMQKVSDLERLNEDLLSKLSCSFSEEQLARMDKMKKLGKIERYIPSIKHKIF